MDHGAILEHHQSGVYTQDTVNDQLETIIMRMIQNATLSFDLLLWIFMYVALKTYHTVYNIACPVFYCRSFENNLKTYKLLAHRKPESELPTVSHLTKS